MSINKVVRLNGFEFELTNLNDHAEVIIDIGDERVVQAIVEREPEFLSALEKISQDYEEIDSVLSAEESLFWPEGYFAGLEKAELLRIVNSAYASDALVHRVRRELGYITSPPQNISYKEWLAMMYGVHEAMPEEEKRELHKWEQQYVDGSGRYTTSDWPGWEKYIGKKPSPPPPSQEKSGYIYLIRAETGEYKVGHSVDVGSRIKAFSVQPPFEYKLVHTFPTDDMAQTESVLHNRFSGKKIRGEWFALDEEDVDEIVRIVRFKDGRFLHNEE